MESGVNDVRHRGIGQEDSQIMPSKKKVSKHCYYFMVLIVSMLKTRFL